MPTLEQTQYEKIKHLLEPGDKYEFVGTEAWKITREEKDFKLQPVSYDSEATKLHNILLKYDVPVPNFNIYKDDKGCYKTTEWWPGKTFRQLINERKILPRHYEEIGWFAAIVGSVKSDRTSFGFENYLPKNLLSFDYGYEIKNKVKTGSIVCDLNKLCTSMFAENTIIRYVLTEDLVDDKKYTFELRKGFLSGYRDVKQFDMRSVLKKAVAFCTDKRRDVYVIPSMVKEVPDYGLPGKTGKSLKNVSDRELIFQGNGELMDRLYELDEYGLPDDLTGKEVLELNYNVNAGMVGLECMLRGANYVYCCDVFHTKEGQRLIFKASDIGKFLAYMHGYDGRDLHYKHIEMNSKHFMDHLKSSNRKFDYIILNGVHNVIAPEHRKGLDEYLKNTKAKVIL